MVTASITYGDSLCYVRTVTASVTCGYRLGRVSLPPFSASVPLPCGAGALPVRVSLPGISL